MFFSDYHKLIQRAVVCIDALVENQLNVILHEACFQRLESSWRGLAHLVEQVGELNSKDIKIKLLNISWRELCRDQMRAVEFDQSQLFSKIYNNEFGRSGGEPFGMLIGDYYISHRASDEVSANDILVLRTIAKVAAAAFVPFIAAASAHLFGMDDYAELDRPLDLQKIMQQAEYTQWHALRQDEDARFLGLILPQVLWRLPYDAARNINYRLRFKEKVCQSPRHYLWGNAVYCFAEVVARAFNESGWFSDIRGQTNGEVQNLPRANFAEDADRSFSKYSTNACITDRNERLFSEAGFITLTENQYSQSLSFYACPSLQRSQQYTSDAATQNAHLSSMLHYILCIGRFAHYIKVIARDKVGSFSDAAACESYLQYWLHGYTAESPDQNAMLRAQYPLREARVQVREVIANPSKYNCILHLRPHDQFDQVETSLQLQAELISNH